MPTSRFSIEPGDKVLFIAIRAMGDTLLATPLVRDFNVKFPEAKIEMIAAELSAQVLQGNPNISKIIISPSGGARGAYRTMYLHLLKNRYKLSIDLISTPGSALISYIAHARTRIGYDLRGRTWAYTNPIKRQSNNNYSAISKYDLVQDLDLICSSPIPEIFPESDYIIRAKKRLKELGINPSTKLIGISPWSKREWRRWEIDNWINALRGLTSNYEFQTIMFASKSEREHLSQLENISDIKIHWAGASHIHEVAALMKHCNAILTGDNGLKHVAVAVDTPTFTIYTEYNGVSPSSWNPPDNKVHQHIIAAKKFNITSPVFSNINNFIRDAIE